jgi:hypothetical protein
MAPLPFAPLLAGVGEVEILDHDRRALVVLSDADQRGDGRPDAAVAGSGRKARKV